MARTVFLVDVDKKRVIAKLITNTLQNNSLRFPTPVLTVQVQRVKLSARIVKGSPSDMTPLSLLARYECKPQTCEDF